MGVNGLILPYVHFVNKKDEPSVTHVTQKVCIDFSNLIKSICSGCADFTIDETLTPFGVNDKSKTGMVMEVFFFFLWQNAIYINVYCKIPDPL